MTDLHRIMPKTLIRCRNNAGLTPKQVAEQAGLRLSTYNKYEHGDEVMPAGVWEDIKKVVGYKEIKASAPVLHTSQYRAFSGLDDASDFRPPAPAPAPLVLCAITPMKHLKILTKVTSFCEALGQLEAHRKEMHEVLNGIESTLAPERVIIMREYINESCAAHAETLKAPT